MTEQETLMQTLRLHGMKSRWIALLETKQAHELSFFDGLELLLQSEKEAKESSRFERLTNAAKFRYSASIEELIYNPVRGLDKSQISQLTSGEYLKYGESVLITGATGCGKSFLASALGHHACLGGNRVLYFNTQKLLDKTKMSRIEGTIIKLFERISKVDLLILDDFGLRKMEHQQQQDLMEIIEDRHAKKSTIMVSQLPVSKWYAIIGEKTIADAILDRLAHTSHRIELKGESLRKKSNIVQ
jgi:DNA replication protein DnaC